MPGPGGRAAIVLPQGKFNNSSLAFIREWILRKARLLVVIYMVIHLPIQVQNLFYLFKNIDDKLADISKFKKKKINVLIMQNNTGFVSTV